jgi:transcriptional regulator with XRE-family HTH domain
MDAGLPLEALAERVGFSPQHISEVERAKTTPAAAFVAAVDRALEAGGTIERLLPPVLREREERRQERAEARRTQGPSPKASP